ncbi:MAG: proteasome ATPase, partial [Candidatus Methylomirabilales bacterium]
RQDLVRGVREEFAENEDLPNTTNPDDWAKIAGRRSERIVAVRPLPRADQKQPSVETVTPGHYL